MERSRKHIHERWSRYLLHVVSPNAQQNQIDDLHHAYFCGAIALCEVIDSMNNTPESTGEDEELMQSLDDELSEFRDKDNNLPPTHIDHKDYTSLSINNIYAQLASLLGRPELDEADRDDVCVCLSRLARVQRGHSSTKTNH